MTKKSKNGDAIVDSSQPKGETSTLQMSILVTPSMSTSLCLWMCKIAREFNLSSLEEERSFQPLLFEEEFSASTYY